MGRLLHRLRSTAAALLGIIAVTFTCYRLIHSDVTTTALALLLAVLFTGTYAKLFETIVAAIVATFCLDYFFIPPIGSTTIADSQDWRVLIVFLTVSVLATVPLRKKSCGKLPCMAVSSMLKWGKRRSFLSFWAIRHWAAWPFAGPFCQMQQCKRLATQSSWH
jgi:hypothetical protein